MREDNPHLALLDKSLNSFSVAGLFIEEKISDGVPYFKDELLLALSHAGLPDKYNPWRDYSDALPFDMSHFPNYLAIVEYISRSDASCLMALPGNSLACRAMQVLGNESQQARFFARYLERPTWTFFAVSEPQVGSDASAITTRLDSTEQGMSLNGAKMFIGGAQQASIGLVFATEGEGRTQLVIVEPERFPDALAIEPLDTYGLAGAGLSTLSFRGFPVQPDDILGYGASRLRQGINALSHVFEKHRPLVAAMALGTARGLLNALADRGIRDKRLWRRYHTLYARLLEVGEHFQQQNSRVWLTSQLKMQTTAFVEAVARQLPHHLPIGDWLDQPALLKKYRDAFAFEYMEGTSNIHQLNAWRGFVASKEL